MNEEELDNILDEQEDPEEFELNSQVIIPECVFC